ncbi:MAG: ribonuclease HI family protein [Thermoanaerobaculia bacterium]
MSPAARAWIDGASRGNPGEAGFGVVFEVDGHRQEIAGFLGRTTNNVAEYAALVAALQHAARSGCRELEVRSDSELLVRQTTGTYRVKAAHLVPIVLKVNELRRLLRRFSIEHVPREENREADALANRAVDERLPLPSWLELERRPG